LGIVKDGAPITTWVLGSGTFSFVATGLRADRHYNIGRYGTAGWGTVSVVPEGSTSFTATSDSVPYFEPDASLWQTPCPDAFTAQTGWCVPNAITFILYNTDDDRRGWIEVSRATLQIQAAPPEPLPIGVIPCSDARGCPDLVVDATTLARDLVLGWRRFVSTDCAVVEGMASAGRRKLLGFTTTYPNLGPGDLFVGATADHPDIFEYATCHMHMHMREYADYRLWTASGYAAWRAIRDAADQSVLSRDLLAAHPELASQLVRGDKRGFCVLDMVPQPGTDPSTARYSSCWGYQGISVGWADEYDIALDGQWIDVTDVAGGNYMLEVEVNAEHLFVETNYANDASAIPVSVH